MMHDRDGTGRTSSKGCIGRQSSLVKEKAESSSSGIVIVVTCVRSIPVLCRSVHQTSYCLVLIIVLLFAANAQAEGMVGCF